MISFKAFILLIVFILVSDILIKKVFKIKMSVHRNYEFVNKKYATITEFLYKYFIWISLIISLFLVNLYNTPAYIIIFCNIVFISLLTFIQGLDQKSSNSNNKISYYISFSYSGVLLITGIALFFFLE
ncbi:MAG: hypothetical protein K0S34_1038 [Bacillales bacterium]|jgi:hypothetical protein|nr:hypothetical protein [Bacillales bacterium]